MNLGPILAEEMLQRSLLSDRGMLALAIVSWCAVVIVMIRTVIRPGRFDDETIAAASDSRRMRLRALMSTTPMRLLQVLIGALMVAAIGSGAGIASRRAPALPAGWKILNPGHEISNLVIAGDILLIGGMAGLSAFNVQNTGIDRFPAGSSFRFIRDLMVDRTGALWIAHAKGIAMQRDDEVLHFSIAQGLPPGAGLGVMEDRAGIIWIGTDHGVYRYESHAFTKVLEGFAANVIFEARDGVLWFGSDDPEHGGLRSFDGKAWTDWTHRLAHRSVNAIIQDRQGALWFATGFSSSGGATRLDRGEWTTLTQKDGLAGGKVRSVFEDREGRLWFGSEYDGIAVTDRTHWRVLTPRDGLAGFEVKQMLQDPDGVYWLGTESGLSRIERFEFGR